MIEVVKRNALGAACLGLAALAQTPAAADFVVNSTIFRLPTGSEKKADDIITIDFIRFTSNSLSEVTFDLLSWEFDERNGSPTFGQAVDVNGNGRIAFLDTEIFVLRDDGALSLDDILGNNDDSPLLGGADGSIDPLGRDSFLSLLLGPGAYILAVSSSDLTPEEVVAGLNIAGGNPDPLTVAAGEPVPYGFGDYRATVTGDVTLGSVGPLPVPLPNGAGLGAMGLAAICAVGAVSRRRA